jgi:hypothetical protein
MDRTRFILEATSLQVFTAHAAINTLRLSGSITAEQSHGLITGSSLAIHEQLETALFSNYDVRFACPFPYTPAEFILERSSSYAQPQLFVRPTEQIPKQFAANCELEDSNVLQRIGWSLFAIRGNFYWEAWLKSIKII